MKLVNLVLTNVCLHRHFEIDFQDGLIGFFGPQGSGKTTAVNAAYAALTNDYSRFTGGKAGVPCQQADSHEPSKIVLTAEHAGQQFKLTRVLQPSNTHRLESAALAKPITKAGEIDEALSGILGGSHHLLNKYVFVPQWGLRDLFNLTAAERAKTLSYLCGTTLAEQVWDMLGKQLDLDNQLAVQVYDNSDELRQQLGEQQSRLDAATAALVAARTQVLSPKALKDAEASVQHERRMQEARQSLAARQEAEPKLKSVAVAAVKTAKEAAAAAIEAGQVLGEWQQALHAARITLNQYTADLRRYRQQQQDQQVVADLQAELSALQAPQASAEIASVSADMLEARLQELRESLAPHDAVIKRLSRLEASPECPTCGQPLANPRKQLEQATAAAEPLREQIAECQRLYADLHTYSRKLAKYTREKDALEVRIADRQKQLAQQELLSQPESSDVSVTALEASVASTQTAVRNATARSTTALQAKANAIASHQACKSAIEELLCTVAEALPAAKYAQAKQVLESHRHAELDVVRHETVVSTCTENLAAKQKELAQLAAVIERSAVANDWVQLLARARSVLHRDALPRIVHEAALRRMEEGINEMLDTFESPFTVKTSPEDLSYTAYFRNGTVMPAQGLSGGQQVVLSLALRWTLNSLFASQIGMMVLDEPTAGLDARHIDLLETALRGLGEAARARGCQVLIITHERRLEGVFDQVVELERIVT